MPRSPDLLCHLPARKSSQSTTRSLLKPHIVGIGACVALFLMIPGLLFSRLHVTDGFLFQIIAYVQLTLSGNHLETVSQGGYSFAFVEFLPGYPLLLSLFSRVGTIQPAQLQFMPIAGLLIPLFYYALAQTLWASPEKVDTKKRQNRVNLYRRNNHENNKKNL